MIDKPFAPYESDTFNVNFDNVPLTSYLLDKYNISMLKLSKYKLFRQKVKWYKFFRSIIINIKYYDKRFDYSMHNHEKLLFNIGFTNNQGKPIMCYKCGSTNLNFIDYLDDSIVDCMCKECNHEVSVCVNGVWY